ncbi:MAG: sodium/proline symporter [Gammaproteobacteria bacterium]|nr:sodium/proline symporter [Gammaproteobacteria bacterium]
MSRAEAIGITLLIYMGAMLVIGMWASRRTRDETDFLLGGRKLGAWVAALSASASSSSAWTLLGVSGAAYNWGLSAVWLFPAIFMGYLVNWVWVGPRLRRLSLKTGAITLTEVLAGDREDPLFPLIMKTASVIIVVSFMFYVASQLQAAGHAFDNSFALGPRISLIIGVVVVVAYTLMGGFWAVSVTDMIQGLLMVGTAVLLPVAGLVAVGGPEQLMLALKAVGTNQQLSWTGSFDGIMAVAFVVGLLGIGAGYPGQPHVVNRFMALRDESALRSGRIIALTWCALIYSGTLIVGLCARVLYTTISDGEMVFFEVANRLLSPAIAGVVVAAVLSAIMSTADSQLLVAASSVSHDWRLAQGKTTDLKLSRQVMLGVSVVATLLALFAPEAIFSRVLFAWSAVGSAFAPPLLVRLAGYRVTAKSTLAAMTMGAGLTVVLYLMPDTPGDVAERLLPFVLALGISIAGIRGRSESV